MDLLQLCAVLGVQPGASVSEVKQAYRDLVQVWHPDRFGQASRLNTLATQKMQEINQAYEQLMKLAEPTGYVPLPSRPAQRPNPAPPPQSTPPKPQPQYSPPQSAPQPQQKASPVYQSVPLPQSRQQGKRPHFGLKVFPILLLVCVLGYFSALSLEEVLEYRFFDHPRALCGNWRWKTRNGSGLTLYNDGTGLSTGEGGSSRAHIHWTCRDGIMRIYDEVNPKFVDTVWTEWRVEEDGDLICNNQGRGAEGIRSMMVLSRVN